MNYPNRFFLVLLLYSLTVLVAVARIKRGANQKLHFVTEPMSQLSSLDGSRVNFKCIASPPSASIKWLRNGSIIKNDEFDWIKVNNNKLVLKLQKSMHGNSSNKSVSSSNEPVEVFQCLAEFEKQVIVSQPANVIYAELHAFEPHENINVTVISGNTAVIPCKLPQGVPFVISEFEFSNETIAQSRDRYRLVPSGSLQIFHAKPSDSGVYRCVAHNPFLQERVFANHVVNLKVIKPRHITHALREPAFVVTPKEITNSFLGQNITIECVANGHPVPKIVWEKVNGELPKARFSIEGGNLHITTLEKSDEGTYSCSTSNGKPITATTKLEISEQANIVNSEPYEEISVAEGQDLELSCEARGSPKPFITWLHNGYIITSKDLTNRIAMSPNSTVLKITRSNSELHAGVFQCFATNQLGSIYSIKVVNVHSGVGPPAYGNGADQAHTSATHGESSSSLRNHQSNSQEPGIKLNNRPTIESVFIDTDQDIEPATTAIHESGSHNHAKKHRNKKPKNKNLKMIPPHNPIVSKLNDDSVMVRWSVSTNSGVPISFFKVQYREVGKGEGQGVSTVDEDILPHIFSYAVSGLNPNSKYRFRIAAVYVNDDNAKSNWTKFSFPKYAALKKPNLAPTIVNANAFNQTEISLHWEFFNIESLPIDGFFIYYRTADSAGEYLKVTAIGSDTRAHNITHLVAGMTYEIKMQCFNSFGTSNFSNIYTVKTLPKEEPTTEKPTDESTTTPKTTIEPHDRIFTPILPLDPNQIIVIIAIIAVGVIIVCVVICLIRCNNQAPVSKVIKNGKTLKSSSASDYYFNSANVFDRRANGQLASLSASRNSLRPAASEIESEAKPLNMRLNHNPLNPLNEMSSLNRKNSFRSSLSSSTHHLFNVAAANGRSMEVQSGQEVASSTTTSTAISASNNLLASTATIDRKRMKSCVESYLDYPRLNHHSASFTRLNGTLERKRRSRNDLNTLDRAYLRNISTHDLDRQSNGNMPAYFPPQNGPIVIMQSSC